MKTLKLKYFIIATILLISSSVYSQSDTGHTYYTDDFSIILNEISDSNAVSNQSVGKTDFNLSKRINNINVISFLNDSIISVSNKQQSNLQLNINKINSVKIKKGSKLGIGMFSGVVAGLALGIIIGKAMIPKSSGKSSGSIMSDFDDIYLWAGGLGGMLFGMGIGAGIGSSIKEYKTIDLNKHKNGKRIIFESIFKAEKSKNNPDNW